ncbi:cation-translocating P-type ATPase [Candidatus Phytoplasma melaleucae]|uniref:Cation-transporting P-type ATPase n=1 Tax=Candidatus Phytoplasma melaleucae TaxID=2982630 RepID=A0ABT9DDX8_9MOLU|nr:cation-transporting P-type ATPase ['Melaleuca sp.' phytoplasma]MDO8168227.1 cation-transporting P-type ATPase ['Melaleuca sp.' phytoplasma]
MKKEEILKISNLSQEEVFRYFKTSYTGLDSEEVTKRQTIYGLNIIKSGKNFSFWKHFIKQFISMFAILLWISGFLAFCINEIALGVAIITVVVVNGVFSFFQEHKAEKILSSLSDMIPKKIQVYRNKKIEVIDTKDLTIGDLVFLEVGVTVPADVRLIEANNFFVDNSMLSGETIPLNRTADLETKSNIITEISNLVYAGTTISQGSAKGIVYSIGENTQIGEVSSLAQTINKNTSTLEKEIHIVVKKISTIASLLSVLVFIICLWRFKYQGESSWLMALKSSIVVALGMLVANIPEGLLPTINLSLAIGTQRMSKRKALIKQLYAVETLSSATIICTDKTGTLTENQITCKKILFSEGWVDITGNGLSKKGQFKNLDLKRDNKVLNKLFIAVIICSEANLIHNPENKNLFQIVGNPTEGALLIAASKYGLDILRTRSSFSIDKITPFSSESKKMSALVTNLSQEYYDLGSRYLFIKGAPNVILEDCDMQYKNNQVSFFSQEEKVFCMNRIEELSEQGYRLLAIAYKKIEQETYQEKDMVFLGFAVNFDPPKIEVREAVSDLLKAGLRITVITGDYGPTAISIGKKVGLIKDAFLSIDGVQLDNMSQEELQETLKTKVPIFFSRTTPKHKLRITEAYCNNNEIVGVIGDGVNDILAMKAAHIGITMGKSSKDVVLNAADMILLDDNFSTIPKAVLESRSIYDNIKKFMTYVFCSNIPQIFPIIFMALFKIPLYLTIMQILAIDLITDLLPAIALGAEEPEKNLLNKNPRTDKEHLLDKKLLTRSYGFLGLIEGILALIFFLYYGGFDLLQQKIPFKLIATRPDFIFASTMAFGAVIFSQIGNVFACRSDELYFWQTAKKKNKLLIIGILCELLLFILISQNIYVLNNFFKTSSIEFKHYFSLSLCVVVILLCDTFQKFFLVRRIKFK